MLYEALQEHDILTTIHKCNIVVLRLFNIEYFHVNDIHKYKAYARLYGLSRVEVCCKHFQDSRVLENLFLR